MADLEGKTIAATYRSVLNVGTANNQELDGTPRVIADGAGNASKLFLSTDSVLISGSSTKLEFNTDGSGEYIWGDGTDLRVYSGADIILMATTNVGIGTALPATTLEIQGGLTTTGAVLTISTGELTVDTNDVLGRINFQASQEGSGTDARLPGASIHALAADSFTAANNETALIFSTASSDAELGSGTDGAVFERIRILSNGFVGIGSTAASQKLHVHVATGALAGMLTAYDLADTEQSRWIAYGRNTSSEARYATIGVVYNASGTGATDEACGFLRLDETDGNAMYLWCQNDNDLQISGTANDIGSTAGVAIGDQPSDERLKNISSDAFPYGLNEVNQLTPIKYAYKKNPDVNHIGFGAQTTKSIIPECVYNSGNCLDGYTQDLYTSDDDEVQNGEREVGDEKGTQTPRSSEKDKLYMKYVEIVPVLVKAIQELSAKVTALENA